jgi:uroporphyrinogen decarboxylase
MSDTQTTLTTIELDLDGFHCNLQRKGTPNRVFHFEHGVADTLQRQLHEMFGIWAHIDSGSPTAAWDRLIASHTFLGHEYFRVFPPGARMVAPRREGEWTEEGQGAVSSWNEFEAYEWPKARDADLSVLDYLDETLPENMRVFHVVDIWEVVRDSMGFETVCLSLYEEPELVAAIFDKVGAFVMDVVIECLDHPSYGAVYLGDDLGYRTSLMIAPDHIQRYILPWHKKIADLAHSRGKLFFFHSCGMMYDMIDAYIDEVGIDAKHSFEDNVMPVTDVKKKWGDRLSLLGGLDVDFLARSSPSEVRKRTRDVLEVCYPGGGYCLGSGNWVTEYIPIDNYLAMLDEGRRFAC